MARVGIALGSNLGDREAHMHAAVAALRELSLPGEPVLLAPFYETAPCFCPPGSPAFLNTVVEIARDGDAPGFLELLLTIEASLGRVRGNIRNAPRVIDMDLLYMGDQMLESDTITLPHPRIFERRFVLQPLADIRPGLVLPGQTQSVREMLELLPEDDASMSLYGRVPPTPLSE